MNLGTRKRGNKFKHLTDFASAKSSVHSRRKSGKVRSFSGFSLGFPGSKKDDKDKKGQSRWKKIAKRIGIIASLTFLFGTLFGILLILGVVSAYSQKLPDYNAVKSLSIDGKETIIVDRNGKELYRLRGDVIKEKVSINDVPPKLQWAFLAAEDAEFRNHKGLNIIGLTRAMICNAKSRGSEECGGGSSITQQLVKVATKEDQRALERKIKEAILAMKIEQEYSKDQILEFYVNGVSMGGIYEGVKTGSHYFFGKEDLNKLTLAEMAYLAGIPNAPTTYSPAGGTRYDPEKSRERANYVLDRMLEIKDRTGGAYTEEDIKKAKEELSTVVFLPDDVNIKAPHFVNYILDEYIDPMYADKVGPNEKGRDYLRNKGYKIVTSVDLDVQQQLEENIKTQIKDKNFQGMIGAQNAAAVMMDPRTGEITAMVGSRDYNEPQKDGYFSPKHDASRALRSMGSSMKPALYLTAFTQGYNPSSIIPDMPLDLRLDGSTQAYNVSNYDRGVYGRFCGSFATMRCALKNSLNVPAVSTFHLVGGQSYADTYVKLNGWEDIRKQIQGPSAPLGAANMPLLEQVHAFATMGAEGIYHPKKVILEIQDDQGKVIYNNRKVEGTQVIDKKYIYLINDMNKHYWLFESDALLKNIAKTMDIAGKTGTSDNSNGQPGDNAFIAYTPTFVLGMWAGNSCGAEKCPLTGKQPSGEALYNNMYKQFLDKYWKNITPARFAKPEGVRTVSLCNKTGRAMSDDCTKAGGSPISEIVADTAMPKQEDMIQKATVTMCPDVEKLARQVDTDLGLSQEKYYLVYKIFSSKRLNDQVLAKSKLPLPPTDTCNIERILKKTAVSIISPLVNGEYYQGDNLQVVATIEGDIPLQKVDVALDGNIKQTYTTAPFSVNLSIALPSDISLGTHIITVVATDKNGLETRDERGFIVKAVQTTPTIAPIVTFTRPTDKSTLNQVPITLQATLSNVSTSDIDMSSSYFKISKKGGANSTTLLANFSGDQMSSTSPWIPTENGDYVVQAFLILKSGDKVVKTIDVRVN